jgi:hypothetical protein
VPETQRELEEGKEGGRDRQREIKLTVYGMMLAVLPRKRGVAGQKKDDRSGIRKVL